MDLLAGNGQKMAQGVFVDGKQHGPSTEWYENGRKAGEGAWEGGSQHGFCTYWHPNGQKME